MASPPQQDALELVRIKLPPSVDCGARFMYARLPPAAGYLDVPSFTSDMRFDVRCMPALTTRIVRLPGRVLELWSPNSLQHAFLPGFKAANFNPTGFAETYPGRRHDGHTGKFDPIYAPQYANPQAGWWPFMRRHAPEGRDDYAYAAFAPLTRQWDQASPQVRSGRINISFIEELRALLHELDSKMEGMRLYLRPESSTWANRPQQPAPVHLAMLQRQRSWDDCVDCGVAIQRGLREKEAWLKWVEERFRQATPTPLPYSELQMPLADDNLVGVWINGMDEETALRHMLAGVPCFIAHEYSAAELESGAIASGPEYTNLLDGTDLAELLTTSNPYFLQARKDEERVDAMFLKDDGRGPVPERLIARAGYCQRSRGSAPKPGPAPSAPATSRAPSKAAASSEGSSAAPAVEVPSERNPYEAPELERRQILSSRCDWIVPPPIREAASRAGTWERWELAEWGGATAWVGRGKKHEIRTKHVWYDRHRKRSLHFNDLVLPRGVLDEQRFGAPVPRHPFFYNTGQQGLPHRPSHWMYPSREGIRGDEGRTMRTPPAHQLP
ncbi:hypothetical protein B0H15DRAFT_786602, partial [Mycena belliarum]